MNKTLCWSALIVSVAAAVGAAWGQLTLESRVAVAAENAVRTREAEIVNRLSPHLTKVYADFGLKDAPKHPKTIDELVEPLFRLTEDLRRTGERLQELPADRVAPAR